MENTEERLLAEAERLLSEVDAKKAELDKLLEYAIAHKSELGSDQYSNLKMDLLAKECAYKEALLASGKALNRIAETMAGKKEAQVAEKEKERAELQASLEFHQGLNHILSEENKALKRLGKRD